MVSGARGLGCMGVPSWGEGGELIVYGLHKSNVKSSY